MRIVSQLSVVCCAGLLVVGCKKGGGAAGGDSTAAMAPADSTAAAPAPAPAPAPALSLADVAGKWQMTATPNAGKDTSSSKYVLTATADTTGWVMTFPSGLKVPVMVSVSGDSLLTHTGTFSSQRRKGVKVMTEGSYKLQGGKLVGTTTAHYSKGADTVLTLHDEGTKTP
jgi:hypothetical protein